jgi:hypothetical protein
MKTFSASAFLIGFSSWRLIFFLKTLQAIFELILLFAIHRGFPSDRRRELNALFMTKTIKCSKTFSAKSEPISMRGARRGLSSQILQKIWDCGPESVPERVQTKRKMAVFARPQAEICLISI